MMKKTIVNSLPKAGTNLLAKCLLLAGYRERGHLGSSIVLAGPIGRMRRLAWIPIRQGYLIGVDSPVEIAQWAVNRFLNRAKQGEFVTAHTGYTSDVLHSAVRLGFAAIVVSRDPRAVLNSFVQFVVKEKRHPLYRAFRNMDEKERYRVALAGMQQGSVRLQSLRQRCLAIEPWLSSGESLQIRFEDIVGHRGMDPTKRSVRRCMCFFAFLDIPTGGIDRVARELFGPGRSTFRQGQVNTWHDEMPKEVARLAETELADLRAKWGYT